MHLTTRKIPQRMRSPTGCLIRRKPPRMLTKDSILAHSSKTIHKVWYWMFLPLYNNTGLIYPSMGDMFGSTPLRAIKSNANWRFVIKSNLKSIKKYVLYTLYGACVCCEQERMLLWGNHIILLHFVVVQYARQRHVPHDCLLVPKMPPPH